MAMTQKEAKIHKEAMTRFEVVETKEKRERELAVEDAIFNHAEDGMWTEDEIKKRKDRPRLSINKVAGAIKQVVGDQRQTQTDIKVVPVSGGASKAVAKVMSGIIRNIEAQSKANNAYNIGFKEMVTGGYGGWRVITEFGDDSFNQEIKIRPLRSAASSLWFDTAAQEYDKRDANWAFYTSDMSTTEFKDKYPNAIVSDFSQTNLNTAGNSWYRDDVVRVAEYWKKVPVKRTIALLSDGRVIDIDEDGAALDELAAEGATVLKTRKVKSHKVVMYLVSGSEVLEGPHDWAGKYIPLIPVYGDVAVINGRTYCRGMTRLAKDPSREYNYAVNAVIESTALTPKDPIWLTPKQAKDHVPALKNFNNQNSPFMFYNPDPDAPGMPMRGGAPALQTALITQQQQASTDIHATTGLEPASLGNVPELKSGKAILAQQAMGDRGMFEYTDNEQASIQYTGDILVDLIPRIMDTEQMVRVLNIDGSSEDVMINHEDVQQVNQTVIDTQTGDKVIVNDLSLGKYSVTTATGPMHSTQRQESAQKLIDLAQVSPRVERLSIDLIAKNMPILESEELHSRLRKDMIKEGSVEPTEEEIEELGLNEGPPQPDEAEQALLDSVNMKTELDKANIENKDADTLAKQISAQQDTAKTLDILVGTIINKVNAGLPLSPQEMNLVIKQRDIVAEGQQDLDEGPNSVQAADLVQQLQIPQQ